jgi:hypothetical protein
MTISGSPRRLRITAGIRTNDPWNRERVVVVRKSVEHGPTKGRCYAANRTSARASRVVQRAIHRRRQPFSDDFLDVKFADVRSDSTAVAVPPTIPLHRIVSRLVDRGEADSYDRPVAEVANETPKSGRRVWPYARLRVGRITSERRSGERDGDEDFEFLHGARVEVASTKGNRRANTRPRDR